MLEFFRVGRARDLSRVRNDPDDAVGDARDDARANETNETKFIPSIPRIPHARARPHRPPGPPSGEPKVAMRSSRTQSKSVRRRKTIKSNQQTPGDSTRRARRETRRVTFKRRTKKHTLAAALADMEVVKMADIVSVCVRVLRSRVRREDRISLTRPRTRGRRGRRVERHDTRPSDLFFACPILFTKGRKRI